MIAIQEQEKQKDVSSTDAHGKTILFGRVENLPLFDIKIHHLNRKTVEKHALLMAKKIRKYGFLDTIKVFNSTDGTMYTTAEGAHRILALQILFGPDSSVLIPVLILPSVYDTEEVEDVLNIIIELNKDNKPWTMRDYVEKWSETPTRPTFKTILKNMDEYEKKPYNVTNAQMCSIYTGEKSTYRTIKDGSFKLKPKYEEFVQLLIDYISSIKETNGVGKEDGFFATVTQNFIIYLWDKMDELSLYDFGTPSKRLDYMEGFLGHFSEKVFQICDGVKAGHYGVNLLETDHTKARNQFEAYWNRYVAESEFDYKGLDKL